MNIHTHKRGWLVAAMALITVLTVAAPTLAQEQKPPTPVPPALRETPNDRDLSSTSAEDRHILEGDQTVSGGSFTLASDETLKGDLSVFGGSATTEEGSRVEGDINIFGGSVDIAGTVTGDVSVIAGSAHLRKGARVDGKLTTLGGSIQKDEGAVASKGSTELNGPIPPIPAIPPVPSVPPFGNWRNWNVNNNWDGGFFGKLGGMILATLFAIVTISIAPKNIARTIDTVRSLPLVSGGVGALTYVAVPVVMALMAITICLIPGAIMLALIWGIAILVGWTAVALMLGEWLMRGFGKRDWTLVGRTAIGAFVLALLGSIGGPIGWLVGLIASSVGLGALLLSRFGTQKYPPTGLQVYTPTSQGPVSL